VTVWPDVDDDGDEEFEDQEVAHEERDHAIISMWREGILEDLTRSPSDTERRVALKLIAEAQRLTGRDTPW
jgi:hypothetical protein